MLSSLYQKIDALPALKLELDPDAKRYFTEFYNKAEDKRVAEPMQGKRAMIGKAPEKVGKLAGILHALNCTFNGQPVANRIPKSTVQAAVKFVIFTANQIDVLYTEFTDRAALAPNLARIVTLLETKGTITHRDVTRSFSGKQRPTTEKAREWMSELVAIGMAATTDQKKYTLPGLSTSTLSTNTANPDSASVTVIDKSENSYRQLSTLEPEFVDNVDKCRYFIDKQEPYSARVVEIVDNVDNFLPPSQDSPIAEFDKEESPQPPPELEVGARVRYVGDKAPGRVKQYGAREMTVVEKEWCKLGFWEFTCSYHGGTKYTTRLMADELELL
jgi:hypothetical protein